MIGSGLRRMDWISVLFCCALIGFGWGNIYSSTVVDTDAPLWNLSTSYGKQLVFITISFFTVVVLFLLQTKLIERFSSLVYLLTIILLIGLFPFGKTIAGATSWYGLGFFNLQPSELAKIGTILALGKYLSDIQTDLKRFKHQFYALLIILVPVILIVPQPDPGSALIFFSLVFILFREGVSLKYFWIGLYFILLFISTLKFNLIYVGVGISLISMVSYFFFNKRLKLKWTGIAVFIILSLGFASSVQYVFENVFEQRHRDRFSLWLNLEKDPLIQEQIKKTIGYNTYQSEKAIEAGGFWGKGFLEGTRTKGDFVPEQHTDYIFSTVGEEWGFVGTFTVILLFTALLLRLLYLAERQTSTFNRVYGYGVVSILATHYIINIGMVIGLLPTVGVPLPFFSYGGSGLLGFCLLLFIFIKLDANRLNEWD
ncbi:MAG: rod shape-determining protein RodA [Flavobacteriaceae bacterium]|nr:rod shape-determining protein RodA [Flavobacteriaceae bacterium]NVJ73408.1 rod shape-determining protein RodA [Flavobacteriaceae bacterium]